MSFLVAPPTSKHSPVADKIMEDSTGVSSATSSSSTAAGLASLSRPQMKIKVISRSKLDYVRQSDKDMHKVQRNFDPRLHPFEKAIEYTRALNATKLDKVFAKPFVFALNEHRDSVFCMSSRVGSLVQLYSGACDGGLSIHLTHLYLY
jgi:WD repeat and SOF domain-containing protein 1